MKNLEKEFIMSSNSFPYEEIGEFPDSYSMGNLIKRLIDGLGYRYHWATESLTESDLSFRVSDGSRTSLETLEHLLAISGFILRVSQGRYNKQLEEEKFNFVQIRQQTLNQLQEASQLMGQMKDEDFKLLEILIKQRDQKISLPLWIMINGPISDAIYHTGQIVLLRRISGNPINPNIDIFTGKNTKK